MLKANNITWYDSNDIRKAVEQGSNFGYDLWYYWTQSGYEIPRQCIGYTKALSLVLK